MRSSGSASWSSKWTSLTLTGAFKLYIRVAIFITAGPDVRVTTKPAPSGHRRVTAQLLPPHPHSRSLGLLPAGQRGQNAGNADGRAPNCVQVRSEAQKTEERPHFNKGAVTPLRSRAAHAKTHSDGVPLPVCRLHVRKDQKHQAKMLSSRLHSAYNSGSQRNPFPFSYFKKKM